MFLWRVKKKRLGLKKKSKSVLWRVKKKKRERERFWKESDLFCVKFKKKNLGLWKNRSVVGNK